LSGRGGYGWVIPAGGTGRSRRGFVQPFEGSNHYMVSLKNAARRKLPGRGGGYAKEIFGSSDKVLGRGGGKPPFKWLGVRFQ